MHITVGMRERWDLLKEKMGNPDEAVDIGIFEWRDQNVG